MIVIGCGELAAVQVLSEIIEAFHKKYPLVSYDIFTANADLVKEQMEKGLIDIGVLLEPIDMEKFDFIRMAGNERWGVLMRPDDPLANKEVVSAKDLENLPLILPRRTNVQNELSNWLGDSFQNAKVLFTSNLSTNGVSPGGKKKSKGPVRISVAETGRAASSPAPKPQAAPEHDSTLPGADAGERQ